MINVLIDLLEFLRTSAPLLTSLCLLTLASVWLAKSLKKQATAYYVVVSIPFMLVAFPLLISLAGVEVDGFVRVPVLGEIVRDYIHMGTFGHPLLILIMYMGALEAKNNAVKRLMSIRKELSIIVGFPVLTHSLIRVINNLPDALHFFADRGDYLSKTKVVSELGAGITSFSFVFGLLLVVLFIPLWVTSFDWVRKHIPYKTWKNVQKWAYVLYAALFIHAMGIQVGGLLNPRGGNATKPTVETLVKTPTNGDQRPTSKRAPSKGLADIKVSDPAKRYIHIGSLVLIYGSYLFLRLRKARRHRREPPRPER